MILLGPEGRVTDFEMNDKCAAGTGQFLEVMARALGYGLDEMGAAALALGRMGAAQDLLHVHRLRRERGHRPAAPRRAARRASPSASTRPWHGGRVGMLKRVARRAALLFAGGVARNPAMVDLIAASVGGEVLVTPDPQTVGALGAALHGSADQG